MHAPPWLPRPYTTAGLRDALAVLTAKNAAWLRAHPSAPSLYAAGVRYQRERRGAEDWQTIPDLLRTKAGDCEDLACALAAELQVRDGDGFAHAFATKVKRGLWHIRVKHGDGWTEDPSSVLGMKGRG